MKSGVKVTVDRTDEVLRSIKDLISQDVLVGITAQNAGRDDGSPINNAEIAYIQTYGGTINMPAREQVIYRQIDAKGNYKNNGRFVKAKKANFATSHMVPAHTVNIPPRPFLQPAILKATDEISDRLGRAATAALDGNKQRTERELDAAGMIGQNAAQQMINSGLEPALAPSTLASRRSRGRTGTKPLIDTGQLRNSITYVVRKKK